MGQNPPLCLSERLHTSSVVSMPPLLSLHFIPQRSWQDMLKDHVIQIMSFLYSEPSFDISSHQTANIQNRLEQVHGSEVQVLP